MLVHIYLPRYIHYHIMKLSSNITVRSGVYGSVGSFRESSRNQPLVGGIQSRSGWMSHLSTSNESP